MKVETEHKITMTHDDIYRAIVQYLKQLEYLDKDVTPAVDVVYEDGIVTAEVRYTNTII